jgi:hypothetical protein
MTHKPTLLALLLALMLTPTTPAQRPSADGATQTFTVSAQFFSDVYFKFSPTSGTVGRPAPVRLPARGLLRRRHHRPDRRAA